MTKVRSKKWGDRWSKDIRRKSSWSIIDGHMSFEKCWVGGKAPKVQRSSCIPTRYCWRRFRILCSILRTRITIFSNDRSKSHEYRFQIARLRWTSSRRSIGLHPSKNGRCSQIIESSQNRNFQTFGFVYHDTNGPNHRRVSKTQLRLLSGIFMVILWQDYYGKGNLRRSYSSTFGRKISNWECPFVHRMWMS